MIDMMLTAEPALRLGTFLILFTLCALLEAYFPRRDREQPRKARWWGNLSLSAFNTLLLRLLLPLSATEFALYCADQHWGLLNLLNWWHGLEILVAIVIMDLIIYAQHVLFHHNALLWRLHRVHHTDIDLDVTSAARFHPIEIGLSMLIKFSAIALLGISPVAVILFEVILNGMAMFNHSNLRLPLAIDAILRNMIVTPDFHRVHHSINPKETNSNYGFNLSVWDRIFQTYRPQPVQGHDHMILGLEQHRETQKTSLKALLIQPFRAE
ncbi:sterol desaturase [Oleiphilus messinensis]|uniref:Sterol desaturase n=1 Tax=Oleiphilus messinensis TaxID=141451 RepID=A0A1Y0IHU6_9GAMM|nr:sterol desaturase family protein [Oleiphilus messinensis]ARU59426.1 sterol desaturase [Oleiphilus messinensis]